ncbi:hypothetical protein [Lacrimispora brassicae]
MMFLDTISNERIYNSLASILTTDVNVIKEYITERAVEIVSNNYNEHVIKDMEIDSLKNICRCENPYPIEHLIVHHIAPREFIENVFQEGICTLPHALVNKTVLSLYLAGLGFQFKFEDNHLLMKKDGKEIDVKKLNFSNLLMRLGGKGTTNDFNVNGYLFAVDFRLEHCRGWLGSPEILKSLSNAFGDRSIADNYTERCSNYLISFQVPINKIDIENFNADIDNEMKTELLIKYSVNLLAFGEVKKAMACDMYNPIIFLKRDFDVPAECIKKIWKLKCKNGILTPVDLLS